MASAQRSEAVLCLLCSKSLESLALLLLLLLLLLLQKGLLLLPAIANIVPAAAGAPSAASAPAAALLRLLLLLLLACAHQLRWQEVRRLRWPAGGSSKRPDGYLQTGVHCECCTVRGNHLVAVQAQHPPARHRWRESGGRGWVTHVLRRIPPLLVLWGLVVVMVLLGLLLRIATAAASPAAGWEAAAPVLPLLAAMLVVLLLLVLRRIKDVNWQGCRGVLHLRCPVGPGASLSRATIGRLHVLVLVLRVVLQVVQLLLLVLLLLVLLVLRVVLVLRLVLCRRLHVPVVRGG